MRIHSSSCSGRRRRAWPHLPSDGRASIRPECSHEAIAERSPESEREHVVQVKIAVMTSTVTRRCCLFEELREHEGDW